MGLMKELIEQGDKRDKMLFKISKQSKVIKVLQKYGKNPNDIQIIFQTLMASGVYEKISWSVVKKPKLLSKYLQMKADGISDIEIGYKFMGGK